MTPQSNHDMALPHVGLLAYFRRPASLPQESNTESSPPPYDEHISFNTQNSNATTAKENDEEASLGFWGERKCNMTENHTATSLDVIKYGYQGIYAICCLCFAISVCILGAFGAFFVVDLVFTQLGMGTGMATWMVHRNVGRGVARYEMQFCLATPNRQAPGPQTWRYVEGDAIAACTTEVLTLLASSSEVWKVFSDDSVSVGDDFPLASGFEMAGRVLSVAEKVRLEELGEGAGGGE